MNPAVEEFRTAFVDALDSRNRIRIRLMIARFGMSWPKDDAEFDARCELHRGMEYYRGIPEREVNANEVTDWNFVVDDGESPTTQTEFL